MNVDLRPSTRRMIEESRRRTRPAHSSSGFAPRRYTDYTIDCHIRRLLFVMPRLSPGLRTCSTGSRPRNRLCRERHPRSRFLTSPAPGASTRVTCAHKDACTRAATTLRVSYSPV